MRRTECLAAIAAVSLLILSIAATAQTTLDIWPGVAPGSEHWTWQEKVFHDEFLGYHSKQIGTIVEDVVRPTLTIYLPAHAVATGSGLIIAPGGACIALVMKPANELARMLQSRGVAAFVLEYRLKHKLVQGMPKNLSEDKACRWGIADAVQALKVVRQHAKEWSVSPDRIGMLGFSAGGMIASEALVQKDAALRPNFVGLIYGAPFESMPIVPSKLPPVFMAWAQDDHTAGYAMARFYAALMKAGDKPEVHIYRTGGHGFAANVRHGGTSDHWAEEFYWWLQAEGFAGNSAAAR